MIQKDTHFEKSSIVKKYKERLLQVQSIEQITKDQYHVYILTRNDRAIVVGHGKFNRARVIFDDLDNITKNHIKAIFVRLYHIYDQGEFRRYIIPCEDKKEASGIEKEFHLSIGGNKCKISDAVHRGLFHNLEEASNEALLINIALVSSFDGLSDLLKWRRLGFVPDKTWSKICEKLAQ